MINTGPHNEERNFFIYLGLGERLVESAIAGIPRRQTSDFADLCGVAGFHWVDLLRD